MSACSEERKDQSGVKPPHSKSSQQTASSQPAQAGRQPAARTGQAFAQRIHGPRRVYLAALEYLAIEIDVAELPGQHALQGLQGGIALLRLEVLATGVASQMSKALPDTRMQTEGVERDTLLFQKGRDAIRSLPARTSSWKTVTPCVPPAMWRSIADQNGQPLTVRTPGQLLAGCGQTIVNGFRGITTAIRLESVNGLLGLLHVARKRVRPGHERVVLRRMIAVFNDAEPQIDRRDRIGGPTAEQGDHLPLCGLDERAHAAGGVHDECQVYLIEFVHGFFSFQGTINNRRLRLRARHPL